MQPSADEDNDDVIESFWLYIFSVFPSFVYYYRDSTSFKGFSKLKKLDFLCLVYILI